MFSSLKDHTNYYGNQRQFINCEEYKQTSAPPWDQTTQTYNNSHLYSGDQNLHSKLPPIFHYPYNHFEHKTNDEYIPSNLVRPTAVINCQPNGASCCKHPNFADHHWSSGNNITLQYSSLSNESGSKFHPDSTTRQNTQRFSRDIETSSLTCVTKCARKVFPPTVSNNQLSNIDGSNNIVANITPKSSHSSECNEDCKESCRIYTSKNIPEYNSLDVFGEMSQAVNRENVVRYAGHHFIDDGSNQTNWSNGYSQPDVWAPNGHSGLWLHPENARTQNNNFASNVWPERTDISKNVDIPQTIKYQDLSSQKRSVVGAYYHERESIRKTDYHENIQSKYYESTRHHDKMRIKDSEEVSMDNSGGYEKFCNPIRKKLDTYVKAAGNVDYQEIGQHEEPIFRHQDFRHKDVHNIYPKHISSFDLQEQHRAFVPEISNNISSAHSRGQEIGNSFQRRRWTESTPVVPHGLPSTNNFYGINKSTEVYTTGIAQPPSRFSSHITYSQSKISRSSNDLTYSQPYSNVYDHMMPPSSEMPCPTFHRTNPSCNSVPVQNLQPIHYGDSSIVDPDVQPLKSVVSYNYNSVNDPSDEYSLTCLPPNKINPDMMNGKLVHNISNAYFSNKDSRHTSDRALHYHNYMLRNMSLNEHSLGYGPYPTTSPYNVAMSNFPNPTIINKQKIHISSHDVKRDMDSTNSLNYNDYTNFKSVRELNFTHQVDDMGSRPVKKRKTKNKTSQNESLVNSTDIQRRRGSNNHLDVRQFLATWDEESEDFSSPRLPDVVPSNSSTPVYILDCSNTVTGLTTLSEEANENKIVELYANQLESNSVETGSILKNHLQGNHVDVSKSLNTEGKESHDFIDNNIKSNKCAEDHNSDEGEKTNSDFVSKELQEIVNPAPVIHDLRENSGAASHDLFDGTSETTTETTNLSVNSDIKSKELGNICMPKLETSDEFDDSINMNILSLDNDVKSCSVRTLDRKSSFVSSPANNISLVKLNTEVSKSYPKQLKDNLINSSECFENNLCLIEPYHQRLGKKSTVELSHTAVKLSNQTAQINGIEMPSEIKLSNLDDLAADAYEKLVENKSLSPALAEPTVHVTYLPSELSSNTSPLNKCNSLTETNNSCSDISEDAHTSPGSHNSCSITIHSCNDKYSTCPSDSHKETESVSREKSVADSELEVEKDVFVEQIQSDKTFSSIDASTEAQSNTAVKNEGPSRIEKNSLSSNHLNESKIPNIKPNTLSFSQNSHNQVSIKDTVKETNEFSGLLQTVESSLCDVTSKAISKISHESSSVTVNVKPVFKSENVCQNTISDLLQCDSDSRRESAELNKLSNVKDLNSDFENEKGNINFESFNNISTNISDKEDTKLIDTKNVKEENVANEDTIKTDVAPFEISNEIKTEHTKETTTDFTDISPACKHPTEITHTEFHNKNHCIKCLKLSCKENETIGNNDSSHEEEKTFPNVTTSSDLKDLHDNNPIKCHLYNSKIQKKDLLLNKDIEKLDIVKANMDIVCKISINDKMETMPVKSEYDNQNPPCKVHVEEINELLPNRSLTPPEQIVEHLSVVSNIPQFASNNAIIDEVKEIIHKQSAEFSPNTTLNISSSFDQRDSNNLETYNKEIVSKIVIENPGDKIDLSRTKPSIYGKIKMTGPIVNNNIEGTPDSLKMSTKKSKHSCDNSQASASICHENFTGLKKDDIEKKLKSINNDHANDTDTKIEYQKNDDNKNKTGHQEREMGGSEHVSASADNFIKRDMRELEESKKSDSNSLISCHELCNEICAESNRPCENCSGKGKCSSAENDNYNCVSGFPSDFPSSKNNYLASKNLCTTETDICSEFTCFKFKQDSFQLPIESDPPVIHNSNVQSLTPICSSPTKNCVPVTDEKFVDSNFNDACSKIISKHKDIKDLNVLNKIDTTQNTTFANISHPINETLITSCSFTNGHNGYSRIKKSEKHFSKLLIDKLSYSRKIKCRYKNLFKMSYQLKRRRQMALSVNNCQKTHFACNQQPRRRINKIIRCQKHSKKELQAMRNIKTKLKFASNFLFGANMNKSSVKVVHDSQNKKKFRKNRKSNNNRNFLPSKISDIDNNLLTVTQEGDISMPQLEVISDVSPNLSSSVDMPDLDMIVHNDKCVSSEYSVVILENTNALHQNNEECHSSVLKNKDCYLPDKLVSELSNITSEKTVAVVQSELKESVTSCSNDISISPSTLNDYEMPILESCILNQPSSEMSERSANNSYENGEVSSEIDPEMPCLVEYSENIAMPSEIHELSDSAKYVNDSISSNDLSSIEKTVPSSSSDLVPVQNVCEGTHRVFMDLENHSDQFPIVDECLIDNNAELIPSVSICNSVDDYSEESENHFTSLADSTGIINVSQEHTIRRINLPKKCDTVVTRPMEGGAESDLQLSIDEFESDECYGLEEDNLKICSSITEDDTPFDVNSQILPIESVLNWPYLEEEVCCESRNSDIELTESRGGPNSPDTDNTVFCVTKEETKGFLCSEANTSNGIKFPKSLNNSEEVPKGGTVTEIKCRLSWKKIFNLSKKEEGNDLIRREYTKKWPFYSQAVHKLKHMKNNKTHFIKKKSENTLFSSHQSKQEDCLELDDNIIDGLELGPAKIELRLATKPSDGSSNVWEVVDDNEKLNIWSCKGEENNNYVMSSIESSEKLSESNSGSVPIVVVKRLILTRRRNSNDFTSKSDSSKLHCENFSTESKKRKIVTDFSLDMCKEIDKLATDVPSELVDKKNASQTGVHSFQLNQKRQAVLDIYAEKSKIDSNTCKISRETQILPRVIIKRSDSTTKYESFLCQTDSRTIHWQPVVVLERDSFIDNLAKNKCSDQSIGCSKKLIKGTKEELVCNRESTSSVKSKIISNQVLQNETYQNQEKLKSKMDLCKYVVVENNTNETKIKFQRFKKNDLSNVNSQSPFESRSTSYKVRKKSRPKLKVIQSKESHLLLGEQSSADCSANMSYDHRKIEKQLTRNNCFSPKDESATLHNIMGVQSNQFNSLNSSVSPNNSMKTPPAVTGQSLELINKQTENVYCSHTERKSSDKSDDQCLICYKNKFLDKNSNFLETKCLDSHIINQNNSGLLQEEFTYPDENEMAFQDDSSCVDSMLCEICNLQDSSNKNLHNHHHCPKCELTFKCQADLKQHVAINHPSLKEMHHCLLCKLSFTSLDNYHQHTQSHMHHQLANMQHRTIHKLFTLFTGKPCPDIPAIDEDAGDKNWFTKEPDAIHFYHQETPLQIAIQGWANRKKNLNIPLKLSENSRFFARDSGKADS